MLTAAAPGHNLMDLGQAQLKENAFEAARATFASVLATEENDEARLGLVRALSRLGELGPAAATLRPLLDRRPVHPRALFEAADIPAWHHPDDLLAVLDQIAETPPTDPYALSMLGLARARALDRAHRYDEAWQQAIAARESARLHNATRAAERERRDQFGPQALRRRQPRPSAHASAAPCAPG